MKEKQIKELKEVCEKEIIRSEIAIGFYKMCEVKEKSEQHKADYRAKMQKISSSLDFNKKYLDYLNTL